MVNEDEVREAFCEVGRRVWQRGFVAANDGNFSFRLRENQVLCTPTQISKGFMKPADMVIADLEGNQLGGRRASTSEIRIHLSIYRNRPDIYSVVHVHPPHALAFAISHREVPKGILPEVEVNLGEIPMAPYACPGTWEFAHSIDPWVQSHDSFLLTNHGALTVGQDPYDAYYKMETLDQYCRVLMLAEQTGGWRYLNPAAMRELLALKKKMGIRDPRNTQHLYSPGSHPGSPPEAKPEQKFRPHPGPIDDSPKISGAKKTLNVEY